MLLKLLSLADKISVSRKGKIPKIVLRKSLCFQILPYHRVGNHADDIFDPVPTWILEKQVRHLSKYYRVKTVGQIIRHIQKGDLPSRVVAITFDDGYRDNWEHAFPILQKYDLPATLFVSTGPLETGQPLWHDVMFAAFARTRHSGYAWGDTWLDLSSREVRQQAVQRFAAYVRTLNEEERDAAVQRACFELQVTEAEVRNRSQMLAWDQVREMAESNVEIGAHTVTHPILSQLSDQRQKEEITHSIDTIEKRIGKRPCVFAYPNGRDEDFNEVSIQIMKESGIKAACTTEFGNNTRESDMLRLRRGAARLKDENGFAWQMLIYRLIE